ncbi:MAG: ABC transporter permease [Thermoleophilaceae bacterium]
MSAAQAHAAPPELRPVAGPSALGGDPRRLLNLTVLLAVTEFRLRFFGSALGYFWQLARPLMIFGVLYVIFTQVVKFGTEPIDHYPVYLLSALVIFTGFAEATSSAVKMVVERENLVRKVHFPRLVIPLSVVLTALFNLGLNLVAVFAFVLISGIEPRVEWLQVPLLLIPLVVFATGVAMLLSALFVRFRDVGPIYDVVLQVMFYGTPIFYSFETVPESVRTAYMSSPLASIVEQFRHAVIDPDAATAAQAIGGAGYLLIPAAVVVGVFMLGLWVFQREAPRVAEEL